MPPPSATIPVTESGERPVPRSVRWPWARAGLSTLIAALLPFTWVVQIEGCTQTVGHTDTGLDLLERASPDLLHLSLGLAVVLIMLAEPSWSRLARHASSRAALHLLGFAATALFWFEGLSIVFGNDEVRAVQPAGYLVLLALFGCIADAIARVLFGVVEWSAERTGGSEPASAPGGGPGPPVLAPGRQP